MNAARENRLRRGLKVRPEWAVSCKYQAEFTADLWFQAGVRFQQIKHAFGAHEPAHVKQKTIRKPELGSQAWIHPGCCRLRRKQVHVHSVGCPENILGSRHSANILKRRITRDDKASAIV